MYSVKFEKLNKGVFVLVNILVVEDDAKLNQIVCAHLNKNGYSATGCFTADEAYNVMYNSLYDMIISDIMLPKTDGFAFLENVRKINKNIPVIYMTAKDDYASKEKGFKLGVDDYMVKPIDLDELVLRVGAVLRRANIVSDRKITVGSLVLDADEMTASVNGENVPVTVREFNILYKLLSYPKKTFSRSQLLDEFWGVDSSTSLRSVDVYITKLREKFACCEDFKIVTIHGLGYKAVLK
jgi:DNA-binding response OmpR family regulator